MKPTPLEGVTSNDRAANQSVGRGESSDAPAGFRLRRAPAADRPARARLVPRARQHAPWRSVDGFKLPFDASETEDFTLRVGRSCGHGRLDAAALADAKRFGGRLFQVLFRDELHGLYRDATAEAQGVNHGVRVTLCLSDCPDLMDLPWGYLYDAPDFLAVSALTPVVRLAARHGTFRHAPKRCVFVLHRDM